MTHTLKFSQPALSAAMQSRSAGRLLVFGNLTSATTGTRGAGEDLIDQLAARGWDVTAWSRYRGRARRLIDMLHGVWTMRGSGTPAYVEVYSGAAFTWAETVCWALRRMSTPYVLTLHGGNLPAFARHWPGRMRRLLASAEAVTTPSRCLQNEFVSLRDDILLLPNALDLRHYPFRLRTPAQPRLAWLRAFHHIYDPTLAVEVVSRLAGDFPDIQLEMIGPDKDDGTFEQAQTLVEVHNLTEKVMFPGSMAKSDIPARLSAHDIFLNTTTAESFGVAVMEAAACGLCIVTTNVGELPYLWTHNHDALLVPPHDADAMAQAVRRILTEPELAERLSRNAHATAERYDWSMILPRWEALLNALQPAQAYA